MVDLKKKLLELHKNCSKIVQEKLLLAILWNSVGVTNTSLNWDFGAVI
jgi:hypothetical protein